MCAAVIVRATLVNRHTNTHTHAHTERALNCQLLSTLTSAPNEFSLSLFSPHHSCNSLLQVVVSISTSRSRDGLETYQCLVSVSSREKLSTSRFRFGLGHLRLVLKTNFRPNGAGHSTQCERALDVVSLYCSYYCSSY